MGMVYVSCNGDAVGEQIGNAIMSDDHQALAGLSRKFKDAHMSIEKWAQKKGGEIVASSGDEVIFSLPEEALGELESVKEAYAQASGTTLTIGIGQTISQASKALIYGKLNEKNQIVEYEPQMDDYISGEEEGESEDEIPSPDDIDESASDQSHLNEGVDSEEESEDGTPQNEELEGDVDQVGVPADQVDEEYGSGEMEEEQLAHEQGMGEGEEFVHDAEENEEDEADPDIIEADAEGDVLGDETPPFVNDESEAVQDSDNDLQELSEDDLAETGDDGIEGQEGFGEESEMGEEPMEEGSEDIGSEADEFLHEMMHSNMDESGQDPETDELKQKIFEALQSIKQNREVLEQIKVQNPDLYQGIIANIQSMIEMGKKLGLDSSDETEDSDMEQPDGMIDPNINPDTEEQAEDLADPDMMGDELEAPVKKPMAAFQA